MNRVEFSQRAYLAAIPAAMQAVNIKQPNAEGNAKIDALARTMAANAWLSFDAVKNMEQLEDTCDESLIDLIQSRKRDKSQGRLDWQDKVEIRFVEKGEEN